MEDARIDTPTVSSKFQYLEPITNRTRADALKHNDFISVILGVVNSLRKLPTINDENNIYEQLGVSRYNILDCTCIHVFCNTGT